MSESNQDSQNPPEDANPANKPAENWPLQGIILDRQMPQPSSTLICFLSCLCTGLLCIILILFITITRQGVNQMEQEMEVKLRNLSLGIHSRMEGLSHHGSQMMKKVAAMQSFVKSIRESNVMTKVGEIESLMIRILSDEVAGSLSNDNQRILVGLGELADEIWKTNDTVDPLCDKSWVHDRLSCYLLVRKPRSWSYAKQNCEDKKGHLVVINDKEEMDFLKTVSHSRMNWWMGLKKEKEEESWKWVDGTSYETTPTFWKNVQTNYWEIIWMNGRYGKWDMCGQLVEGNYWDKLPCSWKLSYICEKKMS